MGSGIFTTAVKHGVAPHTEFWQQFQNYTPPSLRVIRKKFARTIYNYDNIYDSQLNRPESVSLASLARQLYICVSLCRMSNHMESRESNTRMLKVSIGR